MRALVLDREGLAEPLACAYNAVAASGVTPGDWAVVVGPGPLGLFATRLLTLRGALVLVAGTREERLEMARRCGADAVCDVRRESLPDTARERTGGLGADAALELVGSPEALGQAIQSTCLGGRIVLAGEPEPGGMYQLDSSRFFFAEHQLVASIGAQESFPRVLRLLAERLVDAAALVTHRFGLEDALEAVRTGEERRGGALKVLVHPAGAGVERLE